MKPRAVAAIALTLLLVPSASNSQTLCMGGALPICSSFTIGTTSGSDQSTLWVDVFAYPGLTMEAVLVGDHSGGMPFNGLDRHLFEPFQMGDFRLEEAFYNPIADLETQIGMVQDEIDDFEAEVNSAQAAIDELRSRIVDARDEASELMDLQTDSPVFPVEFNGVSYGSSDDVANRIDELDDQVEALLEESSAHQILLSTNTDLLNGAQTTLAQLEADLLASPRLAAENLAILSWSGELGEDSFDCAVGENGCGFGTSVVPEPVTLTLLATGLLGIGGVGLRRRRKNGIEA